MEIILYVYFGISLFIAGMGIDVYFNTRKENIQIFFILIFFGGILALWDLLLADRLQNWFNSSEFGFWWKMYINKKYDNLKPEQINYIKGQISAEKENKSKESQKLIKHLTKILKRNGE